MNVSDTIPKNVLDALQRSFTIKNGPPPKGTEVILVNTKYGKNNDDPLSFGFIVATHHWVFTGTNNCCPECPTCRFPITHPDNKIVIPSTKE